MRGFTILALSAVLAVCIHRLFETSIETALALIALLGIALLADK